MSTQDKKSPIETFREASVCIKLWDNTKDDRININASIEKTYKDKDGNYRKSYSLNGDDLMRLQMLIPKARDAMKHEYEQLKEGQKSLSNEQEQSPSLEQQREEAMKQAAKTPESTHAHEKSHSPDYSR